MVRLTKEEKQRRKDIVRSAKCHIKSMQVALSRFLRGSDVERTYVREHFEKLGYHIEKI